MRTVRKKWVEELAGPRSVATRNRCTVYNSCESDCLFMYVLILQIPGLVWPRTACICKRSTGSRQSSWSVILITLCVSRNWKPAHRPSQLEFMNRPLGPNCTAQQTDKQTNGHQTNAERRLLTSKHCPVAGSRYLLNIGYCLININQLPSNRNGSFTNAALLLKVILLLSFIR